MFRCQSTYLCTYTPDQLRSRQMNIYIIIFINYLISMSTLVCLHFWVVFKIICSQSAKDFTNQMIQRCIRFKMVFEHGGPFRPFLRIINNVRLQFLINQIIFKSKPFKANKRVDRSINDECA